MTDEDRASATLLAALEFAAHKHRDQRRKGAEASPYINHPIQVARLLAEVAGVTDVATLVAAVLHDTIEDTQTTAQELGDRFGPEVRALVEEVTDDKRLPRSDRKRLQIERASLLSPRAKLIKIADKIANIRDVAHAPPQEWTVERRRAYLDWAADVIDGCRGTNPALEACWDATLAEARRTIQKG